jgi:RNA polymerase sigma-70 factor (ECF subfamily)
MTAVKPQTFADRIAGTATARDRLVQVAGRVMGNKDDAEDAAHDAIVQALSTGSTFRAEAQPSTWMHRVAVNASLMRLRKQRRATQNLEASRLSDPDAPWLGGVDRDPPADERLARDQELERLRTAVEGLPPLYRELVERVGWNGETPAGVAKALGLSRGCVRTRLGRARRQLREALGDEAAAAA